MSPAMPQTPPADDDISNLIELDLPVAPATAPALVAAPAITAAPVAQSPLVAGRALLVGAPTVEALKQAAFAVTDVCTAAGITDKAHPTREALRALYLATLAWFVGAPLRALWMRLWVDFARAVEIRPSLVTPITTVAVDDGLSLEQTLGGIAGEGASNASIQALGSMAGGQLRGVGFSTAQGYIDALAHGVKAATAASYKQLLRSQFQMAQHDIESLVVTIIPESDLPVGAGVHHAVAGKAVSDMTRAEAHAHFAALNPAVAAAAAAAAAATKAIRETADAATVLFGQKLLVDDSPTAWWEIGWTGKGAGSITRAELTAACGEAPDAKVNSTQLSRTMDSLRSSHDCDLIAVRPAGVKVRWQVGRGKQHASFVGAEYGKVLAIVDLLSDNTLAFDGDLTIADEVKAEYSRLCGSEVLRPGDVTAWLTILLRDRFSAIRNGDRLLVGPTTKDPARELCGKIAKVWSVDGWVRGRLLPDGTTELGHTVKDVAMVLGGIWQGLGGEITAAEGLWAMTVENAKDGKVGARAAATALDRIDNPKPEEGLIARINEFSCLGAGPLTAFRARAAVLRAAALAAIVAADDGGDGAVRALMLDLK